MNIQTKIKLHDQKVSEFKESRLALNIGSTFIGWSLYTIDSNRKPIAIVNSGVRVFSSGRRSKDNIPLNTIRRQIRLQRRQRDRYLQRRNYLIYLLKKYNLFPHDKFSAKKLTHLNPYQLRANGLDKKLDIYHFGRVLFHLNQKRGFKSNRKSSDITESGIISKSIKSSQELMDQYHFRTYGELLWHRFQKMEKSRQKGEGSQEKNWVLARKPIGSNAMDNYSVYASRKMIEDEFHQLWNSQSRFHSQLKDELLKKLFFQTIFSQRALKKAATGTCRFTGGKRAIKALPSVQRFEILKKLNSLSYYDHTEKITLIHSIDNWVQHRDQIIRDIFLTKEKISCSTVTQALKKLCPHIKKISGFQLDVENNDKFQGDKTNIILTKIIPCWTTWSLQIQDCFIELLEGENGTFIKDDEEVLKDLEKFNIVNDLNLSREQIEKCLNIVSKLPQSRSMHSQLAIQKMLPLMEKGYTEEEATRLSGLMPHKDITNPSKLLEKLPLYQEVIPDFCLPIKIGKKADGKSDLTNYRIPNPTAHIILNQLRLVVNDIIRVYGKPTQTVIKTEKILTSQKSKKKENHKKQKSYSIEEKTLFYNNTPNALDHKRNLLRYRLWEQQKGICVYSGKSISEITLYTPEWEVDHILPWSRTLDDSIFNKVLVHKEFNCKKGNHTPFEIFSRHPQNWKKIIERVNKLSVDKNNPFYEKKWRFKKSALHIFSKRKKSYLWKNPIGNFCSSHFISRYLEKICNDIWIANKDITASLKNILGDSKDYGNDFRRHAKDAMIIGLIDHSFIQSITDTAKIAETQNKSELETIGNRVKAEILPWESFKKDAFQSINQIIVSHRKRIKKENQLHEETSYGLFKGNEVKSYNTSVDVIHYANILKFEKANEKKILRILSDKIRADFLKVLKESGELSKDFLKHYHQIKGTRRIRLKENRTVIPITNRTNKVYKVFQGSSNYAARLFESLNGKWDAEIVDTFTANKKYFLAIPKMARLIKGDLLFFNKKFWRLIKFDINKNFTFMEHFVSGNPDVLKNTSDKKSHQVIRKIPSSLQKLNPQRVDISPCGIVKLTPMDLSIRKTISKAAQI